MGSVMMIYKVFYKNFELRKGEFLGILIERRKDLRGQTQLESGLKWAKAAFGRMLKNEKTIFVVPYELKLGIGTKWIIDKGAFTKEEIHGMGKHAGQDLNALGEELRKDRWRN